MGKYLKRININAMIDPECPVRSGIPNSSILKSYLAWLCMGKSDFDAVEGFRGNTYFMKALGLSTVLSSPTLHQRMDTHASDWFDLPAKLNQMLLSSRIDGHAIDVGTLACGYTAVDFDIFAMDNGGTHKELVGLAVTPRQPGEFTG